MRGINIISMLIGFWGFNIFPILAQTQVKPESIDNLICFWSFMEESGTERISPDVVNMPYEKELLL